MKGITGWQVALYPIAWAIMFVSSSPAALAQVTLSSTSLGLTGAVTESACAASANGTGHLICVSNIGGQLTATSVAIQASTSATPVVTPAAVLKLGTAGTVGNSSCASTADSTGDVVCGVNNAGAFLGLRFNIFSGKIYAIQKLGIVAYGNASCTNGNARFSVTGPPANEGPAGATICGVRQFDVLLQVIAFNPATGYAQRATMPGQFGTTSNPSCANAEDGTNVTICVYRDSRGLLDALAVDPRTSPQTISKVFTPYTANQFDGDPSCASPLDKSGQVICAVTSSQGSLQTFAMDPRKSSVTSLQTILLDVSGSPTASTGASCTGLGDGTHQVMCAYKSGFNVLAGIRLDPRTSTGTQHIGDGQGPDGLNNPSCTFENINPAQASCGVVDTQHGNGLTAIVIH